MGSQQYLLIVTTTLLNQRWTTDKNVKILNKIFEKSWQDLEL